MQRLACLFIAMLVFIPVFAFADELKLINNYRVQQGYPVLKEDILTCTIASFRLSEVQTNFSHQGFYALGLTNYAENLAKGFTTDNSVFKAWLASQPHRFNFLSYAKYGCVKEQNGYWVFISRHA